MTETDARVSSRINVETDAEQREWDSLVAEDPAPFSWRSEAVTWASIIAPTAARAVTIGIGVYDFYQWLMQPA